MDLMKDLIRDTYDKIDSANSNFCSTPTINARKLTNRIARTILLGKGNLDELLTSASKESGGRRCNKKGCNHQH